MVKVKERRVAASKKVTAFKKHRVNPKVSNTDGVLVDDSYWEVDQIVGRKVVRSEIYYLVRWKGCPPSQDTWEPVDNLCDSAYQEAIAIEKAEAGKRKRKTTKKDKDQAPANTSKKVGRKTKSLRLASNFEPNTGPELSSNGVTPVPKDVADKNPESSQESLKTDIKDRNGNINTASGATVTPEKVSRDQIMNQAKITNSEKPIEEARTKPKKVNNRSIKGRKTVLTSDPSHDSSSPADIDTSEGKKSTPITVSMSTTTTVAKTTTTTITTTKDDGNIVMKRKKISRKSVLPATAADEDDSSQQSTSRSRKRVLSAKSIVENTQKSSQHTNDMRLNTFVEMSSA
jgi:Chromo (CHRromatin Organisation MOdifier) domain